MKSIRRCKQNKRISEKDIPEGRDSSELIDTHWNNSRKLDFL